MYDAGVMIKCDHAPPHKFLTAYALNSKVDNWRTEIARMSHVTFEHIWRTENILANHISWLGSMSFYKVLYSGEGGKNSDISCPMNYLTSQLNKEGWMHL